MDRVPPEWFDTISAPPGGPFAMDVPTLWREFYAKFGYDRPIYTLGHDILFSGPLAGLMAQLGMIRASWDNAWRRCDRARW